jgi:predicted P-loop ATPase/GTPase
MESRLDRIEHLLMEEQKRKLEQLEARLKRLEDALAVEPYHEAAVPWRFFACLNSLPTVGISPATNSAIFDPTIY